MSKKDKLIERLKAKPHDFTLDEMDTLLSYFSFKRSNKGKTSGSRIIYISEFYSPIMLHKPHPNPLSPSPHWIPAPLSVL